MPLIVWSIGVSGVMQSVASFVIDAVAQLSTRIVFESVLKVVSRAWTLFALAVKMVTMHAMRVGYMLGRLRERGCCSWR